MVEHAAPDDGYGHSPQLTTSLEELWSVISGGDLERYGLIPQLRFDAVLARADGGELRLCIPRLVNMMVDYEISVSESVSVLERLASSEWSEDERSIIVSVLDAWWIEVLRRIPGEHHPEYPPLVVLGIVVGSGARMVRWLTVWLDELDGPGAQYLVDAVLGGLGGPAWEGKSDEAAQVLGWARTETVVNGLAYVGATHVSPEDLSLTLDQLIEA